MNRFFGKSENLHDGYIAIDGGDVNHIKNVLRMKPGDELMISGGNNRDYLCTIRSFEEDVVLCDILKEKVSDKELQANIYLFQGLPKADKMELIIQKCVELGVHEIIPIEMKRCVVKLDAKKADTKIKRWQSISESAAKQSGRSIIPQIREVMTFKQAMDFAKTLDKTLVPYELAEGMEGTKKVLANVKAGMNVAVFIGPEGGFEASEVEALSDNGGEIISLGKRILRTETAGFTVMAILMYKLETEE